MKQLLLLAGLLAATTAIAQQPALFMPQNIKAAYANQTRSMDGKPGPKYWQNFGRYNIAISLNPATKTVTGTETITYINRSPNKISNPVIKLILNIHNPGTARMSNAEPGYLTSGIHIDKFAENGAEKPFPDARGQTFRSVKLGKPVASGDSVQLRFDWHYELSEVSGREGKLDSTSFFLAYFYPRVAVLDDVHGWDRMNFTDGQEFYNDFNDYTVAVTVPTHYLVWGTGTLLNTAEVLQPAYVDRFNKSLSSDAVINVVTQKDIDSRQVTAPAVQNTWRWRASNISDVAFCISSSYVWDAASVVVDKKTNRRASCQSAYTQGAGKFANQVKHIQHSLDWLSNNWPGVPYPFEKSTIVQGIADMEYPMMANDSPQEDDVFQRFIAEHEIAHSYFPFYMGINEHRYGFMDEGWTTAFENLIGNADLGKKDAAEFFKQFRVQGWAQDPTDENQVPIITPVNILSGQAMSNNEYGKPALAYLALKDMLGDELFKKCLHGFMDRWHGKHPIPWDMFNSFNNLSGKNLNWFWNNWFFTPYYMDLAVDGLNPSKTGYTLTVKNIGGYPIPTDVVIEYADGSSQTLHQTAALWEKNPQQATIAINTKKNITYLKLDGGIFMDAEGANNTWGAKEVAKVVIPEAELDALTGTYGTTQMPLKIDIAKADGTITMEAAGREKITMQAVDKTTFTFEQAGLTLIFNPAKKEMTLKQGGANILFTKQ
jgi:hypothetical protein